MLTNIGTKELSGTTGNNDSSITSRPFTIASFTKVIFTNNEINTDTAEYSETKTSTNNAKTIKATTKILSTTVDTSDAETNSDTSDGPQTTNKRSKVFSNDVQNTKAFDCIKYSRFITIHHIKMMRIENISSIIFSKIEWEGLLVSFSREKIEI